MTPQDFINLFKEPWYAINYGVFLTFPILRLFLLDLSDPSEYWYEFSEWVVYVFLAVTVYTKYRRTEHVEIFLKDILLYFRLAILYLCFIGYQRAVTWYIIAFVLFNNAKWIPKAPTSSKFVMPISIFNLEEDILGDFTDKTHIVFVYNSKNERRLPHLRDFFKLAAKHTSPKCRFHSIDVSINSMVLKRYDIQPDKQFFLPPQFSFLATIFNAIGFTSNSSQLPTVLAFRKQEFLGQLPEVDGDKLITPLTVPHMRSHLLLDEVLS